jgi:hypothetical protein
LKLFKALKKAGHTLDWKMSWSYAGSAWNEQSSKISDEFIRLMKGLIKPDTSYTKSKNIMNSNPPLNFDSKFLEEVKETCNNPISIIKECNSSF